MEWNDTLRGMLAALGIGLLIGMMRERRNNKTMAGIRTHALVALAGAICMFLGSGIYMVALLVIGAYGVAGYMRNDTGDVGLTGEVALLVNMALAGLAMQRPELAVPLGVVVAVLLQAKQQLRTISRQLISEQEVRDGMVLLVAGLVIMPLLPAAAVDPWGALHPRTVWKVVVLVMAVGVLGHVAQRMVGPRWGLPVAGFFAGFASSTAATVSMGQRTKADAATALEAGAAAILANLASLLLLGAVVWAVAPGLLQATLAPLGMAVAVLLLGALLGLRRSMQQPVPEEPAPAAARAFKLSHALLIAFAIALVSVLSAWLRHLFGDTVAILAAMLAALTELQAAAVSVARMGSSGQMPQATAQWGLVGVLAAGSAAKSVLALVSGSRSYGLYVALALVVQAAAAAAVLALMQGIWG